MEELDLRDLYFMVRKRLWLVVVLFLLATITAGVVSQFILTPEYETYSTIILGKPNDSESVEGITSTDITLNQKLIGTYAEIAKSKNVLNKVREELPFDIGLNQLSNSINVSLLNNTEMIKITVRGTSSDDITIIANTLSQVFKEKVAIAMEIDNIHIWDEAVNPNSPISPNVKMNIAIAGVLGIMMALFIIFMIEMFDHSIKVPEDVQRYLDLPVLGMIPEHE